MAQKNDYNEGRYLYCIVNSGKETDLGQVGIEDNLVYLVTFKDVGTVVHRCEAKPYKTEDKEKAGEWILAHQYVIDLATEKFGTVIPLTFDTIFKGDDETVKNWLSKEYGLLKARLARLEGKAEYGVQIFLDNDYVNKIIEDSEEVQKLKRKLENTSSGTAYLLKKNLEKRIHFEENILTNKYAKELYAEIKKLVEDVKLDSTNREVPEKWKSKQMILNLTCLAQKGEIENLGKMLEGVNRREGFSVRFTGPWPPYSFVEQISESKTEESG